MLSVDFNSDTPHRKSRKFVYQLILLTSLSSLSITVLAELGKVNLVMRANLVSNACSVSTDSVNKTVNLGEWATKQFLETPTPVPQVRFTINLEDCGPAASGVRLTWNGTAHASNKELFSLTPGSTAKNVGVELQDWNHKRIPPGFITPVYGLTASTSRVSIPFYVRYVRVGDTVTAGTANSMATFTLEYL
ncbi:fimbrial protein [Enterobacter mori]